MRPPYDQDDGPILDTEAPLWPFFVIGLVVGFVVLGIPSWLVEVVGQWF